MARESALWQRCDTAAKAMRRLGHLVDLQRIENCATSGHPDVEGCINGKQTWIELKSCDRPARKNTPIRPKKRESQEIWHDERTRLGGSRFHWIMIQVGEAHQAALYLIPGNRYSDITVPEEQLAQMSALPRNATVIELLLRSVTGW